MTERPQLDPVSARLLGVLVEKELTTPDQYPLTLNALVNGANQISNRAPAMSLSEAEVRVAADGLVVKHLAGGVSVAGSRVPRYRHTAGVGLGLSVPGLALLAELVLRGAQTVGELRTRAKRMHSFESLEDVGRVLATLRDKAYVRELPPAPGSRAQRWEELLSTGREHDEAPTAAQPAALRQSARPTAEASEPLGERVTRLEVELRELRAELRALAQALGEA